jgi:[protein-PII] uridylyltransferase
MPDLPALTVATRQQLLKQHHKLIAAWQQTHDGRALLKGRSACIDTLLKKAWKALAMPNTCALVAVGGYGQSELYPASDIDLLILLPMPSASMATAVETKISEFIRFLWDIGLEIGHSVRTIEECLDAAKSDITVQTALLETRHLTGSPSLYEAFVTRFSAALDPFAFYQAKQLEQAERYARFNDTPYSLEPNCKESPGGLRDLHVIRWVAYAAKLGSTWHALAQHGLVTAVEARQLARCERRLRDLRIQLHILSGRREDRLLFDYQEQLAREMGLTATEAKRVSEVLMQRYYQNAKLVTQLNTLTMQALADRLSPSRSDTSFIINANFQQVREQLDIRDEQTFERNPGAILECFLLQMQRGELKGMTPRTLRALWRARRLINADFRAAPENRARFLSLFQQPHLIHALRLMNQYDILGRYLPAFGRIVGQMQHDLFHVYTVDQHVLQVIRNLRRFTMPELAHEYPFCSRLMADFDRPWLLYLGALFHDIAKGRGGDHSQLGMADAAKFAHDHGIGEEDTELLTFLVAEHLTMSQVAQKQDIADPDVIKTFAQKIGTIRRLTALYLLTVADIRGTSPKVWNAWKGKLLEDLFRMTAGLLTGSKTKLSGVAERQEEARRILRYHGLRTGIENVFWQQLDTGYFMRHDAEEIAWHTRRLYYCTDSTEPIVHARINPAGEGLQVMIYCLDQPQLFARLCGFFTRLSYSILDARIHTTQKGYALDSFIILASAEDDESVYRNMIGLVEHELTHQLSTRPPLPSALTGRLSRQVRYFPITPEVTIRADERGEQYLLNITAADRPGLLYAIAITLDKHNVNLHTAKIDTLGERVEDVLLISGKELTQTATLVRLEQDLLVTLQI